MIELKDKVAVVVGASAEGGTGWSVATALAERGAKIVVAARRLEPLQILAERIGGAAVVCDVSKEADLAALFRFALRTYGRVDLAINAAGESVGCAIADVTDEILLQVTSAHYFSNVYFIKYAAEAIGLDGAITLFSSVSTFMTLEPHGFYAAAKAASDCLVRYAAVEFGPRRIRVNSIQPGGIVSDATRAYFAIDGVHQAHLAELPLRRLIYPEDLADAAVWLSTSPVMTGSTLAITSGNHLTRFPTAAELMAASNGLASMGELSANTGAAAQDIPAAEQEPEPVALTLASGADCPVDSHWHLEGRPDIEVPCSKGFPMPRYGGEPVLWRLARTD